MQISDAQFIALITASVPFLTSLAVFLGRLLMSKLPQNKQPQVLSIIQMGVYAAEQVGQGSSGVAKKKIAEDFINGSLKAMGIAVNPVFVDTAIESLLLTMNEHKLSPKTPASVSTPALPGIQPLDSSNNNG